MIAQQHGFDVRLGDDASGWDAQKIEGAKQHMLFAEPRQRAVGEQAAGQLTHRLIEAATRPAFGAIDNQHAAHH